VVNGGALPRRRYAWGWRGQVRDPTVRNKSFSLKRFSLDPLPQAISKLARNVLSLYSGKQDNDFDASPIRQLR
jgi:hypothetical protein